MNFTLTLANTRTVSEALAFGRFIGQLVGVFEKLSDGHYGEHDDGQWTHRRTVHRMIRRTVHQFTHNTPGFLCFYIRLINLFHAITYSNFTSLIKSLYLGTVIQTSEVPYQFISY